ncbi:MULTISPECIES: response regulator transcription factor [unclassified Streptomyces]|uniref:helix-turn-helix transcriptional regulator n=1 Tax=unclassified Streptomyces TaxID=2593676 RepID=UPI0035E11B3F
MSSVKNGLARQPISSSGNHENYSSQIDYLVRDISGRRASSWAGRSLLQTEIALIIEDDIRRYSIEGMLRSLDFQLAVQSITDIEDLSTFCHGQLIISDSTALGSVPGEIAEKLRIQNMHVLILVDSADIVEQSWVDHANGFLDWADLRPETLREAIVDVKAGRFHVSATLARRSVRAPDQAGDDTTSKRASMIALTAREHQVLRLIAEGLSNRQVARSLSISEHGVKRAVGIILAKLNCPNRTLAVVRAMESGLLVM